MDVLIRTATQTDVPHIVALLADDALGSQRERLAEPLPASYLAAFRSIEADPNNEVIVVERAGQIVGVLQLTFIPTLTYQGGWRAQIEGVRVSSAARGHGLGERLLRWAIARAEERGCHLIQLTTDKRRPDAKRFYERLGFVASHEGMKLHLESISPTESASPRRPHVPPGTKE